MVFSCLVDADFRDTEDFYCAAEGRSVDREWPSLHEAIVGDLLARFDAHMAEMTAAAKATPVNTLRAEILGHVRGRAARNKGSSRSPSRPAAAKR